MNNEEIESLIEQLKAQGLSEDEIMNVFYETFLQGKMDREDLETLANAMGYELTDEFKNDETPDPIAEKGEQAEEGITPEQAEAAKEFEEGETEQEFKEKIANADEQPEPESEEEEADEEAKEGEDEESEESDEEEENDEDWEKAQKMFKI